MRYLINLDYIFCKVGAKPTTSIRRKWAITLTIPALRTDNNPDEIEKYILSHLVTKHVGYVVKLLSFHAIYMPNS